MALPRVSCASAASSCSVNRARPCASVSRNSRASRLALAFVAMDGLWVVGSAILLAGGWVPLTAAGRWAILIVAAIVALFAVLQYYGLRRISRMERA